MTLALIKMVTAYWNGQVVVIPFPPPPTSGFGASFGTSFGS